MVFVSTMLTHSISVQDRVGSCLMDTRHIAFPCCRCTWCCHFLQPLLEKGKVLQQVKS